MPLCGVELMLDGFIGPNLQKLPADIHGIIILHNICEKRNVFDDRWQIRGRFDDQPPTRQMLDRGGEIGNGVAARNGHWND